MFDLVIRGGSVVGPERAERADLGVTDGVIAAVSAPGEALEGQIDIDATDRLVLPGLVDAHAHIPGYILSHRFDDFRTATSAAALGGVTTVMLMPTDDPRTATADYFDRKRHCGEGQSLVDFAIQALIGPKTEQAVVEEMAARGAVSFELFLAYGGTPEFIIGNDDYELQRLMQLVHDVGGIVGVTPHSATLIAKLTALQKESQEDYRRLESSRRVDRSERVEPPNPVELFALTRPTLSEALGIARACTVASETGTRIHLRALSSRRSIEMVRRFRDAVALSSEVMSHHLLFTDCDAVRFGPYGIIVPPLRTAAERDALRKAVKAAEIDMAVSDHSPALREDKELGWADIWQTPPGMPGLQTLFHSMLTLVDDGVLTLSDVVRVCAERPAACFGLYPRKGALLKGSDADIVILDTRQSMLIDDQCQQSKANYTTLKGRLVKGRIDSVYLRGELVAQDGQIVSRPTGRFVRP